nr:unnamed protein product [Digitaria exilis]
MVAPSFSPRRIGAAPQLGTGAAQPAVALQVPASPAGHGSHRDLPVRAPSAAHPPTIASVAAARSTGTLATTQRQRRAWGRRQARVAGGEPSFHLFGFIMCIGATAARALKTVLQGILLSSEGEKLNSMNLLLYMAPIAVIFLLPATIFMEDNVVGVTIQLAKKDFTIVWLLLFNSCLAYFVNLTNFLVTKHTSALTLQVLGNAKGAVAVVVSIMIFRNPVSITGMLGYTLTVIGVILYSESKKRSNKP